MMEVHKVAQKKVTISVKPNGERAYHTTSTQRTSYVPSSKNSAFEKNGNAVKKGAATWGGLVSGVTGSITSFFVNEIPLIFSLIGKGIDSLTRGATNLQGMGETLKKYMELGEAITNPARGALERGDKLDALDDERRSHNSATIGDEKAWRGAFTKATGTNADQILKSAQAYFDMATSGNLEEMDKAWKALTPTGIRWNDLEKGSTWENLVKLIEAYHKAGEDGVNELEPSMQKIFGKRGMDVIRKAGDASSIRSDFVELRKTYAKYVEPNELAILEATDKAEMTREKASIVDLGLPAGAERFIEKGANDVLDISKIKYELYGDGRDAKMRDVMQEEKSDNQNPANRQEQKVGSSEKSNSFSNDSHNEKKYNQEEYKGLFHWDHKVLPDGREQYTSFDPLGQSVKLYEKLYRAVPLLQKGFSIDADTTNSTLMQKYLNLAPNKASQTSVANPELNQSMKDLSNQLRLNTSATTKMTNSFQQSKSSNNTPTVNINATATFN